MNKRSFTDLAVCIAAIGLIALGNPRVAYAQDAVEQPPRLQKKAWEWTVDERLAVRLDPVRITERQNATRARAGIQSLSVEEQTPRDYDIDGRINPELLLPHELFQGLVTGFVPDAQRQKRQRENFRPGITAFGWDDEMFWTTLRTAASDYIDKYVYSPEGATPPAPPGVRWPLCREAFLALDRAREAFGREQFDRFLYEVIAPRTQVALSTSVDDPAADLRFVEAGCE